MAIQTLNTIKNWFKTGLKPSQQQFWDTWDSFRHKFEKVPVKDVEGIDELLTSKADKTVLDNHLVDKNAHAPQINTDWNSEAGFSQLLNKPKFKTINGKSVLGNGDIVVKEGGLQNLDQTLVNGNISNSFIPIILNIGDEKSSSMNNNVSVYGSTITAAYNGVTDHITSFQDGGLVIDTLPDQANLRVDISGMSIYSGMYSNKDHNINSRGFIHKNRALGSQINILYPTLNENSTETINFPPKSGTITLHEDFKTINGKSLIGTGDITINGGLNQNNFVKKILVNQNNLPNPTFTKQDVINSILALPEEYRTVLDTDSKINIVIGLPADSENPIEFPEKIFEIYEIQNQGKGVITSIAQEDILLITGGFDRVVELGDTLINKYIYFNSSNGVYKSMIGSLSIQYYNTTTESIIKMENTTYEGPKMQISNLAKSITYDANGINILSTTPSNSYKIHLPDPSTASANDINIHYPTQKSTGDYTLATTDDLKPKINRISDDFTIPDGYVTRFITVLAVNKTITLPNVTDSVGAIYYITGNPLGNTIINCKNRNLQILYQGNLESDYEIQANNGVTLINDGTNYIVTSKYP